MALQVRTCPGCGLERPLSEQGYDRKFNASAECWSLFEQVIATEFQNALLFGQVHQLTVDTYAVQHAGGRHSDKSVCIHLVGLHLTLERGVAPVDVAPFFRRLARSARWPHLTPPEARASLTVHDVAIANSPETHARRVQEWAGEVWRVWSPCHDIARELAEDLFRGEDGTVRRPGSAERGSRRG